MKFAYLIQGSRNEVENCLLRVFGLNSDNYIQDIYVLTFDVKMQQKYDQYLKYVAFLPNSTWAEGRNELLRFAEAIEYDYFVFIDADARIEEGSLRLFELLLQEFRPALGLPLTDSIKDSFRYFPGKTIQLQQGFDQLVQAYHKRVIHDRLALPYATLFDNISWWYSCEINQFLTLRFYSKSILQFNEIYFVNSHHSLKDGSEKSSIYKGGITRSGLKLCKNYIESTLGPQPFIYGSLFHPKFMPRPKVETFGLPFKTLLTKRKILKRFILSSYHFILNRFCYRLFFYFAKVSNRFWIIETNFESFVRVESDLL